MSQFDNVKILYESGNYFKESLDWYERCYLSSKIQRFQMFVVLLLLIGVLFVVYFLLSGMFPMHYKKALITTIEKTDESGLSISKITGYAHPTLSVADELMRRYVLNRESYSHPGLMALGYIDNKIDITRTLSSKSVFQDFTNSINLPNGLMSNFKNARNRNISILSVEFESGSSFFDSMMYMIYPGKIPNSAKIIFIEDFLGIQKKYLANISFNIKIPARPDDNNASDSNSIKEYLTGIGEKFDPRITFIVTAYKVKEIK